MPARVLVVDDERAITDALAFSLKTEGFQVVTANTGEEGLSLFRQSPPDVVVLDIMLPGLDGFTVCRIIRKESKVPVVLLTARAERSERLMGFECGADDYVVKPFFTEELIARLKAILRRGRDGDAASQPIQLPGITIDRARREVLRDGHPVEMSRKEFDLLCELAASGGRVLSREELLLKIWGEASYIDAHTVDVHICRLREKLEQDPRKPSLILTVRGVGYRLAEGDD